MVGLVQSGQAKRRTPRVLSSQKSQVSIDTWAGYCWLSAPCETNAADALWAPQPPAATGKPAARHPTRVLQSLTTWSHAPCPHLSHETRRTTAEQGPLPTATAQAAPLSLPRNHAWQVTHPSTPPCPAAPCTRRTGTRATSRRPNYLMSRHAL